MIVQLVQSILDVPEYTNEGMSQLAGLFKAGQDSNDILPLLCSNCDDIIATGAWIAGELDKPLPIAITNKLLELVTHSSSVVRYQALVALNTNSNNIDRTPLKPARETEHQTLLKHSPKPLSHQLIAV